MKKTSIIILALLVAFFAAVTVNAQQCRVPTPFDKQAALGSWSGSYSFNGKLVALHVEITETEGNLLAKIKIEDGDHEAEVYQTRVCSGQEIHMKTILADNSSIEFIGRPNKNLMSGRVVFTDGLSGRKEGEVVLKKDDSPVVSGRT